MEKGRTEKVINVELSFKRSELLYDIENYSFVEGDIMETENVHARHQTMDAGQEGNENRITRILNLAHWECVEMLYPYTKEQCTNTTLDDTLESPDTYSIKMKLPVVFSGTTLNLLKGLIHEYLVCRAMEDWMSITNPKSQENWRDKLINLKTRIQTCLMSRRGPVLRKMRPF